MADRTIHERPEEEARLDLEYDELGEQPTKVTLVLDGQPVLSGKGWLDLIQKVARLREIEDAAKELIDAHEAWLEADHTDPRIGRLDAAEDQAFTRLRDVLELERGRG